MISAIFAILLYLATTAMLGMRMAQGHSGYHPGPTPPLYMASAALLLHAVGLYMTVIDPGGLNLGFFNALSLLGWTVALLLIVGALFEPVLNIGLAAFPWAALTVALMLLFPADHIILLEGGWPIQAHVLLSFLAYSLFSLAAVQVILLAIQDRALRHHRATGFVRAFPPIQTMEALLFQMLLIGFVALSLGLLTGAFYIRDMFAQHLIHKTTLSLISWLVFGILLWGRWKFGWRGRKALGWTLAGFITLGLAYPVTKFILEIILGRHWS